MIFLVGLGLGTVSSFLGIGGGIFLVPLLPLIYPLTAYEAIILSLTFIFFSVSTNTIIYSTQKKIVWPLVLNMGPYIVIGGFIGSKGASMVPGLYLRSFLILFLLIMSFSFFRAIINYKSDKRDQPKHFINRLAAPNLGFFAGLLSGFAGVGSGVFLNWLVLQNPNVKSDQESPTVNAMMIFVCVGVFASAIWINTHIFNQFYEKVGLDSLIKMLIGILLGAYLGKSLNSLNLNRARVILLFILTFSLALLVFYETL